MASAAAGRVQVETPRGVFVGFRHHGVATFRGIPYARCGRFGPPERIEEYGLVNCERSGHASPQAPFAFTAKEMFKIWWNKRLMVPDPLPASMDESKCLNLQLQIPEGPGLAPVFVFIHGGAFVFGSNRDAIYKYSRVAKRQRVATIFLNYRLGPFGFLKVPGAPSNLGVRDAIAALRWVQEFGKYFGLDTNMVTVGGESAGAMLTGALLRAPSAKGLFQRAFMMSGGPMHCVSLEDAELLGKYFTKHIDVVTASTSELVKFALKLQLGGAFGRLPFQPCLDGDVILDRTWAEGMDILTGVCENECLLFIPPFPSFRDLPRELLVQNSSKEWSRMGCELSNSEVRTILEMIQRDYGVSRGKDIWRRLGSIAFFESPLVASVRELCSSNRVYVYRNMVGPGHAGELGYIFGFWNYSAATRYMSGLSFTATDTSKTAGEAMEALWGNILSSFVVTGCPAESWPLFKANSTRDEELALSLAPAGTSVIPAWRPVVHTMQELIASRGTRAVGFAPHPKALSKL
eukprot:TRINITY_DN63106_c0_g1_i1.p1 TRINITY_DN63106_c0_g1~~TRINITY_DN63106_c0_g1_i1.p1  ORF type:complete len:519 (+),score=63.13 TRINITY_DN63106_c0_g1_i1:3-1559(+)